MSAVSPNRLAEMIAKRNQRRYDNRVVLTDAQVAKMREEEPSESQVNFLKENKVKAKEIAEMTKYDASERIEKILAELETGPATQKQKDGLIALQFDEADVKDLTYGQARQLYDSIPKRK